MRKFVPASIAAALILWAACESRAAENVPLYATFGPLDIAGSGRNTLDAAVGFFEIDDNHGKRSLAARIEMRGGKKLAFVGPALGALANEEGLRFGYLGIHADFNYGRIIVTPMLAAGVYHRGNSLDMGGPFLFRESLQIAYLLGDRWRAGISIAHMSNCGIYRSNPGQEDVLLTIAAGF